MKLLIIGHARHGKDSLAEIWKKEFGLTFESSSVAASKIFIYGKLKSMFGYESPEECFNDRVNHRALWHELIKAYNYFDKAKLAKDILKENDCYVGMRSRDEINECISQDLFDLIVWVDASDRLPPEPNDSFDIDVSLADIIISNNGNILDLEWKAKKLGHVLFTDNK